MRAFLLLGAVALGTACGSVEQGTVELQKPTFNDQFPAVAEAIAPTCATLDCHGQVGRNFKFYWMRGMRLSPDARPGEGETTMDEYNATFRSLVGLEPYKMDAVVRGAVSPESLTLVRKGRGLEHHKGEGLLIRDSDADICLVQWLKGAYDPDACKRAVGK